MGRSVSKDRELFAALIYLKRAYDMLDRESIWDALRVYGGSVWSYYREMSASVHMNGQLSDLH